MRQKLVDHQPATLHDAGEVTVVTQQEGRTRHRFALVVTFSSARELQRALDAQGCEYRPRIDLPEGALHQVAAND